MSSLKFTVKQYYPKTQHGGFTILGLKLVDLLKSVELTNLQNIAVNLYKGSG